MQGVADQGSLVIVANQSGASQSQEEYQVTVTGDPARSFAYDAAGRLLTDGQQTNYWNNLGQLTAIDYKRTNAAAALKRSLFAYSALGDRVQIVEAQVSNGGTLTTNSDQRLIWNGAELLAVTDALGTNAPQRYFPQGMVVVGTGSAAGQYLFIRDHLGSIREVLTNGTRAVVARYDYDPYGNRTILTEPTNFTLSLSYAGYYVHAPSGLYLTKYRAYDPITGR